MMRELTQEEIDKAPDWATDYEIHSDNDGDDVFYCNGELIAFADEDGLFRPVSDCNWDLSPDERKPIPRKEFDVLDWDANNSLIDTLDSNENIVQFYSLVDGQGSDVFSVNKKDAIAIAKHFKLTAEDY